MHWLCHGPTCMHYSVVYCTFVPYFIYSGRSSAVGKLNCETQWKEGSTAHWWVSEKLEWVHICRVVRVNKVSGRLDGAII